jgi:DnaA family protein
MRQIPLDLSAAEAASFDNYVAGRNTEALAALRDLAALPSAESSPAGACAEPQVRPASLRSVYLWGEPGVGKSHLLEALAAASGASAFLLRPDSPAGSFAAALDALAQDASSPCPGAAAILIDDCERLDDARQQQAFHLYNRAASTPGAVFAASGAQPPGALAIRDDLRTRLGWGRVYRLALLSDDEKAQALQRAARGRGVTLAEDLVRWLLTHRSRDIRWLLRLLDALDRYALERKRAITLPLLREFESTREFEPVDRLIKSS